MIIHSFLQFNYVYKAAHLENIELINLFCTNFLIQAIESILGDTKNTLNCPQSSQRLIRPKTSNPVWPFLLFFLLIDFIFNREFPGVFADCCREKTLQPGKTNSGQFLSFSQLRSSTWLKSSLCCISMALQLRAHINKLMNSSCWTNGGMGS